MAAGIIELSKSAPQGIGGLWGLFLSPIALVIALLIGSILRKKFSIKASLHGLDFVGVAVVLTFAYFVIPNIF